MSRKRASILAAFGSWMRRARIIDMINTTAAAEKKMVYLFHSRPSQRAFLPEQASIRIPQPIGANPIERQLRTEKTAKKWSRLSSGIVPIASRVFAMLVNDEPKPIRNCKNINKPLAVCRYLPAAAVHPASINSHKNIENIITGLLPSESRRGPKTHRLLKPPMNDTEVIIRILSDSIPASDFINATAKADIPP